MMTLKDLVATINKNEKIVILRKAAVIATIEKGKFISEYWTRRELNKETVKRVDNHYYSEKCVCITI